MVDSKPYLHKATFTVGSEEYTAHVDTTEFVPSQPQSEWVDVGGMARQFAGSSSWKFNMAGVQDWETANSLVRFMLANAGEEVDVEFTLPGGGIAAGTVIAAAPKIGGKINTLADFNLSLACAEPPIFTFA